MKKPFLTLIVAFATLCGFAQEIANTYWRNNATGDNVVHYNLPGEQQSAVERFLRVNSYPTYRLIDRNGNMLDVNADPRNLDAFENLIKALKKE